MNSCNVGDVCCIMPGTYPEGGVNGMCSGSSACSGVALSCAGTADCTGTDVCCGQNLTATGGSATCQASCSGPQVCLHSSECPMGMRCRHLSGAGGIRTCIVPPDAGMPPGGDAGDDGGGSDGSSSSGSDSGPSDGSAG
jgi:hypothetical protein